MLTLGVFFLILSADHAGERGREKKKERKRRKSGKCALAY